MNSNVVQKLLVESIGLTGECHMAIQQSGSFSELVKVTQIIRVTRHDCNITLLAFSLVAEIGRANVLREKQNFALRNLNITQQGKSYEVRCSWYFFKKSKLKSVD